MANYANLKSSIQQVVKTNGNQEITGALLQQSLLAIIDALGNGYQYKGLATPETDPGTPDQRVFYITNAPGNYVNFGSGITITANEVAILRYNTAWHKDIMNCATQQVGNIVLGCYNYDIEFSSESIQITSLRIIDAKGNVVSFDGAAGIYNISHTPSYLIANITTGAISVVTSNTTLSQNDIVLLYVRNGVPLSGFLYPQYLNYLIKNGEERVFEYIERLEEYLYLPFQLDNIDSWVSGLIIYSSGQTTNAKILNRTDYVDIESYAGFEMTYSRIKLLSNSVSGIAFYGTNKNYISGVQSLDNQSEYGTINNTVVIPTNAKYVRFTYFVDTQTYGEFYWSVRLPISEYIKKNSLEIENLKKGLGEYVTSERTDYITIDGWIDGKYIYCSTVVIGEERDSSVNSVSPYMDISDFGGKQLTYIRNKTTATSTPISGLCFYDREKTPISGVPSGWGASEKGFEQAIVDIPYNAYFVRFTIYTEYKSNFYAYVYDGQFRTYLNGLGLDVAKNKEDIKILEDAVFNKEQEEFTEIECRNRFYKAMNEWCATNGITNQIIEGPSGYGLGGEVTPEILGHGMSNVPIYGVVKIMAESIGFGTLAKLWGEDSHIIRTKGIEREITVTASLLNHYGSVIADEYTILGWKTGSMGALTNLAIAVTSDDLKGNVLVAVMSRNFAADTEDNNRSLATKYLLDIGKALFFDRTADISNIESLMIAQHPEHAMVCVLPYCDTRLLTKLDLVNDGYFNLYNYGTNGRNAIINTMSMIKLLVAQIVLEYIADIDEYVEITQGDITAATGGTGAIFSAGEKVTYRDLLFALLLPSSNQAGYTLARCVGKYLLTTYRGNGFIPA